MKNSILTVLFNLVSVLAYCQPPEIVWSRTFGSYGRDLLRDMTATSDGNIIAIGDSNGSSGNVSSNYGEYDTWIIKVKSDGDLAWKKSIGGSSYEASSTIINSLDGGYLAAVSSMSDDFDITQPLGEYDFWLVKLNNIGIIEWQKSYGGSADDLVQSVKATTDGGYIVAGYTYSQDGDVTTNNGLSDGWIIKLDANGLIEWQETYGGSNYDGLQYITQTSDGGYIAVGGSISTDGDVISETGNIWIIKLNSLGIIQWQHKYVGSFGDFCSTTTGYAMTGFIPNPVDTNDLGNCWFLKLDLEGNTIVNNAHGGSNADSGSSIYETEEGGFLIGGTTSSSDGDVLVNQGGDDAWLLKLDSSGQLEWQRTFGGSGDDSCISVKQISESDLIAGGDSNSNDGDVSTIFGILGDFWITRLSNPMSNLDFNFDAIKLYPNPTHDLIYISLPLLLDAAAITIRDVSGKIVSQNLAGSCIPTSTLSAGIYTLEINVGNTKYYKKFIKD